MSYTSSLKLNDLRPSQLLTRNLCSRTGLMVTAAFLLSMNSIQAGETLKVSTFENSSNQIVGLVPVQATTLPAEAQVPHQHLILIDTSASQMGEHRQLSFQVAHDLIQKLPANDRVWLWTIDINAQPLHAGFVKPGDAQITASFESLESRIPAGSTDFNKGLLTATQDINELTSVIYLGDGMSGSHLLPAHEVQALTTTLNQRHVVFHALAIGPKRDFELLGVMALRTGGCVFSDNVQVDAETVSQQLAAAVIAPVWFPSEVTLNTDQAQILPSSPLPVRADRDTCYLIKYNTKPTTDNAIELSHGNNHLTFNMHADATQPQNAYLGSLWNRAEQTQGVAVALAGKDMCELAHQSFDNSVAMMTKQGEQAVQVRDFAKATQVAETVKLIDPANVEADVILRVSNKMMQQPVALLQPDNNALENRTDAPTTKESDPIERYKGLQQAAGQRLQLQVSKSIEQAQKMSRTDPDNALENLKRIKAVVSTASDVDPNVLDQLDRKLNQSIMEINSAKAKYDLELIRNQQAIAEIEARKRLTENMILEDERLEQLIDQVRSLIETARHGDDYAYEQAELVAISAVNLRPGNGPATVARFGTEAAGQLNSAFRLRELRANRYLEVLTQVELSHVPFPDEPPIRYPNAQVWKALTERRAKWASVDLRHEGPNEARIAKALDDETEFEFVDTPLKNVMENIAEMHNITIIIDDKALDGEGITLDLPVNLVLSGVTLRSALKILLERENLTWVIEDEVMKITTTTKADEALETRVYPVADLVIQLNSRTAGGGAGGGGGGMMGGGMMGGGGGGGAGGGMGGGGGGVFSIPADMNSLKKKQ
jgi:uncharacterized membrane protein YgcG